MLQPAQSAQSLALRTHAQWVSLSKCGMLRRLRMKRMLWRCCNAWIWSEGLSHLLLLVAAAAAVEVERGVTRTGSRSHAASSTTRECSGGGTCMHSARLVEVALKERVKDVLQAFERMIADTNYTCSGRMAHHFLF